MLEQLGLPIHDRVHPDYPSHWAVLGPIANFGDKVIYSGSYEELRGSFGVITNITHKMTAGLGGVFGGVFEWRYTITLDNGKGSRLTDVRETSFTKV